jgi:hypothetical protein
MTEARAKRILVATDRYLEIEVDDAIEIAERA